jgi:periplasmic protein TonB
MYNSQNQEEYEMKSKEKIPDFEDIVFEGRNKEYGAYALRRIYNKYISISTTGGAIIFALIVSYPLITASLFKDEVVEGNKTKNRVIEFGKVDIPSIDKPPVDIPTPIQPKTPTVKYVAPVVLPDEQVHNDDFATIEDLINKNPGTQTVEGNINGTDYIDVIEPIDIPEVEPVKEQIYTWLEVMPEFPGGDKELINFFANTLSYPEIAKRAGVEGKVVLSFIVDKSGKIKDVEVLKGIGAGCDEEAMRVINSMPNWNPGKQNGKPVLTKIKIPVWFKLR